MCLQRVLQPLRFSDNDNRLFLRLGLFPPHDFLLQGTKLLAWLVNVAFTRGHHYLQTDSAGGRVARRLLAGAGVEQAWGTILFRKPLVSRTLGETATDDGVPQDPRFLRMYR